MSSVHVADQLSGNLLALRIVAAVDEARSRLFASRLKDVKQHFTRHSAERGDDPSLWSLLCQLSFCSLRE
jgi:hypothetical protein